MGGKQRLVEVILLLIVVIFILFKHGIEIISRYVYELEKHVFQDAAVAWVI